MQSLFLQKIMYQNKMNIALISETAIDEKKGTSVYVDEISKNLAKKHNVFLFLPNNKNFKSKKDKFGRQIIYINNINKSFFYTNRKNFLKKLETTLDELHLKNNFDMFHCLYGHYFHFIKKYNRPIYWTCHNVPPNENKPFFYSKNLILQLLNKYFFWIIKIKHRYLIRSFNYKNIIVPSNYVKNILCNDLNINKKKIIHINNGVNLKKIQQPKNKKFNKFTILTIAAFKYHKNLHLIPKILENLENCALQWIIVGKKRDIKYHNQYYKHFNKFILQKKIILKEEVSDMEKTQLYKKSHLYVQLSLNEGFGIPLLESKFYNLNSLSTICGASKEITNQFGGSLIYKIDASLIAKKIAQIFKSKKKYKNYRLKDLNNWNWKNLTNKLNSIYKNVNFK